MEEKLQEIINDSNESLCREEIKVSMLRNKIAFCEAHNFKEEQRIVQLQLTAVEMIVYRQRQTLNEIQELLNKWNS